MRNLLTVSRWGVLEFWLWSVTKSNLKSERWYVAKDSFFSPKTQPCICIYFLYVHTNKTSHMQMERHTLGWPCVLRVWPEIRPEFCKPYFSTVFIMFWCVCREAGKMILGIQCRGGERVAFSLHSPLIINFRFIYNTRDMNYREILLLFLLIDIHRSALFTATGW